jgi:hypothetical protein
MRETQVLIFTYCDVCTRELDTQTEATDEIVLKIGRSNKPKRLDVCPVHKDPTWSTIVAYAIDDLDEPSKPKRVRTPQPVGNFPCKVPGCPGPKKGTPTTLQSLAMHLTRAHPDIDVNERRRLAGTPSKAKDEPATRSRSERDELNNNRRRNVCRIAAPCRARVPFGREGMERHIARKHPQANADAVNEFLDGLPNP